jgi:hypothetical protein
MKDFECHVTLPPPKSYGDRLILEDIARKHKFKTSYIVGDPVLGDAKFFYCTSHDITFESLKDRMDRLVADLPRPILRRKIEQVVFDERTPA